MSVRYLLRGCARHRLAGHSLAELLIAMALGLMATLAAVSLYRGQREAVMRAAEADRMTAAGMAALGLISQHARMAGFAPAGSDWHDTAHVFGCTAGVTPDAASGVNPGLLASLPGAASNSSWCKPDVPGSDGIALRYVADTISTWRSAEGNPTDCLGQNVRATDPVTWTENRFYVSVDKTGNRSELYCLGGGGAFASGQPIVDGVERLHIRYWLHGGVGPVRADAVPPRHWNRVVALDVCVIVRGDLDGTSLRYIDCDGASVATPDRRRRRAYSSRVALRNVVGLSGDE